MLGEFEDDYGDRHTISRDAWIQHPTNRYRIARWIRDEHHLIAQNDSSNKSAPGRWTRIDWVSLPGLPRYTWAFCFSAFDALTAAAAESVVVAHPETPKSGCNAFPFSRMRRTR